MATPKTEKLLHLFNERAPIARAMGMTLAFNDANEAVFTMPHNPDFDHALGGIHGGVMATMLDNAGWFTAAASRDENTWVATSTLTVHYLAPGAGSTLTAKGKMVKSGKRQDVVEMTLHDDAGNLLAYGTGTFMAVPKVALD